MSEVTHMEYRIGATWIGSLSKLLVDAQFPSRTGLAFLHPATEGRVGDMKGVSIIRAGGSEEPIYRPGSWISVSPGDAIRIGDAVLRLT